jgi:hypothetical protein
MLQTEFTFTLPCGYVDEQGNLHRQGTMRRATALDEVEPLGDPRARANEAYVPILMLGRVITRLGTLAQLGPAVVERLFATDFIFLQDLYARVNSSDGGLVQTRCPACGARFVLDVTDSNE